VHEALALSGSSVRLADSAPDSFLMSPEAIGAVAGPGYSLLLSEVYGISYAPETLEKMSGIQLGLRMLDLAMGIPSPERLKQLSSKDVALFSFGWGKPMYAGWGGVACFRDPALAGRAREIRDQWMVAPSLGFRFQRTFSLFQQIVMNQRLIYGLTHQWYLYRMLRKRAARAQEQGCQQRAAGGLAAQWTHPMTTINWKAALYNLRHITDSADLRLSQAEVYSSLLVASGAVHGPGTNALPQSHFPIRIPAAVRDDICDYLRGRGIDTGTLFPFPARLSRDRYPHAARAADEVVTLPLGPGITLGDVRMISGRVKEGLQRFGCQARI
jgi:dTDP-4-amino-4,6-dideoxygalactose transaminase